MQLYAVNFIPLLGSLYMYWVLYTPIIRSKFSTVLQPLVRTIVSSQLLAPSVAWYSYYGLYQWQLIQLKIVLLMMGVYSTRNM